MINILISHLGHRLLFYWVTVFKKEPIIFIHCNINILVDSLITLRVDSLLQRRNLVVK